MAAIQDKISSLIESQFPSFYRDEGQKFVAFVRAYYEWLEETNNVSDHSRKLLQYRDIDSTIDEFVSYFKNKYLVDFPYETAVDKRFLIKKITELYRSKGTDSSVVLLLRLLYNEEASVYLPSEDIIKPSDSTYLIPLYLELSANDITRTFVGKEITGVVSGAKAIVEHVERRMFRGLYIDQTFITNLRGNFITGETVTVDGNVDGNPSVIGSLSTLTVVAPGRDFVVGETITLVSDQKGRLGKAVVEETGSVNGLIEFIINDGGFGFVRRRRSGSTIIEPGSNVYVADKMYSIENITNRQTFAINTSNAISNTSDFITANNTFINRDELLYYTPNTATSNVGLVNNSIYYVLNANSSGFNLAQNVIYANIIDVDVANDFINYANSPFVNNDVVTYIVADGNTAIGGLSNGTSYYIVSGNNSGFALSTSLGGSNVNITPAGSGGSNVHVFQGTVVNLTSSAGAETHYLYGPLNRNLREFQSLERVVQYQTQFTYSITDLWSNGQPVVGTLVIGGNASSNIATGYIVSNPNTKTTIVTSIDNNFTNTFIDRLYSTNSTSGTTNAMNLTTQTDVSAFGAVTGQNATHIGFHSLTGSEFAKFSGNTGVQNNYIHGLTSNTYCQLRRVFLGFDANFAIGPVTNEERVYVSTDFVGGNNYSDGSAGPGIPYLGIKINANASNNDGLNSNIGVVSSVTVINGGTGYINNEPLTLTGGDAYSNAVIHVGTTDNSGNIQTMNVVYSGYGYDSKPVISGGSGSSTANLLPVMFFGYGFPKLPYGNFYNIIDNCLTRQTINVGTISILSEINPGAQYNIEPFVYVIEPRVAGYGRKDLRLELKDITKPFVVGESITQTYYFNAHHISFNAYANGKSIANVTINNGGQGYVNGTPVIFTSANGSGAFATITTYSNTATFAASDANVTSNFITIASNPFTNTEIVKYSTTNTAIGGLANNNYYYVVYSNTSGTALSKYVLFAANAADPSTNAITVTSPNPFVNDDIVTYTTNSTAVGGLSNNTSYYVVYANSTSLSLSTSLGGSNVDITSGGTGSVHVLYGANVDLTTGGTGTHILRTDQGVISNVNVIFSGQGYNAVTTASMLFGDAAFTVNLANDVFEIGEPLYQTQYVTTINISGWSNGTPNVGTTIVGKTLTNTEVANNAVVLFANSTLLKVGSVNDNFDIDSNTSIIFSLTANSVTTANVIHSNFNGNTAVSSNFISLSPQPFANDDYVLYYVQVELGNTEIGDLNNYTKYYVVEANNTGIKLANTVSGAAIAITSAAGADESGHYLIRASEVDTRSIPGEIVSVNISGSSGNAVVAFVENEYFSNTSIALRGVNAFNNGALIRGLYSAASANVSYASSEPFIVQNNDTFVSSKGTVLAFTSNSTANTGVLDLKRLNFNLTFTPGNITGARTGAVANVVTVGSIPESIPIGMNANITSNTITGNGVVVGVRVIDSGLGYQEGEIITLVPTGDNRLVASARVNLERQGVGTGYFKDEKGFLNSNKYIHDNNYYQEYSYEVRSGISIDKYAKVLKEIAHVSGTRFFGNVVKVVSRIKEEADIAQSNLYFTTKYFYSNNVSIDSGNDFISLGNNVVTGNTLVFANNNTCVYVRDSGNTANVGLVSGQKYIVKNANTTGVSLAYTNNATVNLTANSANETGHSLIRLD